MKNAQLRRVVVGAALGAAMLAGAIGAGCNYLGPGLYLLSDDRTPAVYTLDPKRPTVVFVDDRNNSLPTRSTRYRIAKAAEDAILDAKMIDKVISCESLQPIIAGERFSKPLSIAEIGRAVGAEQIVYATVDRFSLSPDGAQFAPSATMRVKVIDATTGERLFPVEGPGGGAEAAFPLTVGEKVRASALPRANAERVKAESDLADELGRRLGELFFKHSSRDHDARVGDA